MKFGGGKVIRDGMGSAASAQSAGRRYRATNALIVDADHGIVKADIGLRDGRIAAIGKARQPGHPARRDHRHRPGTEVIAGEGMIVTAGGIDSHIHFICPQQIEEALYSASRR